MQITRYHYLPYCFLIVTAIRKNIKDKSTEIKEAIKLRIFMFDTKSGATIPAVNHATDPFTKNSL